MAKKQYTKEENRRIIETLATMKLSKYVDRDKVIQLFCETYDINESKFRKQWFGKPENEMYYPSINIAINLRELKLICDVIQQVFGPYPEGGRIKEDEWVIEFHHKLLEIYDEYYKEYEKDMKLLGDNNGKE